LRAFISHSSDDSEYVLQVCAFLRRQIDVFVYEEHQQVNDFIRTIDLEMRAADVFVVFYGRTTRESGYQQAEVNSAYAITQQNPLVKIVPVVLHPDARVLSLLEATPRVTVDSDPPSACARKIVERLEWNGRPLAWQGADALPVDPHLFSYEKDIIRYFDDVKRLGPDLYKRAEDPDENDRRSLLRQKIQSGCPPQWPTVTNLCDDRVVQHPPYLNRNGASTMEHLIGTYRADTAMASTAALGEYVHRMQVPEAGPREFLRFPTGGPNGSLRVGIMVLGGIAPGINAVIDGIVQRHFLYRKFHGHVLSVHGYQNGLHSLLQGERPVLLVPHEGAPEHAQPTSEFANQGGSLLGTCRLDNLIDPGHRLDVLSDIAAKLDNVDILYMIGGDGTMKAAHAIWNVTAERRHQRHRLPLSVVAIPKTMDNDILWVWQSFGFMSAVEKAREFIQQLHTEVTSNPRVCVLQLFGSDSGFVVSHAVLASASGHCDVALIPEVDFSILGLARHLERQIAAKKKSIPAGLVVMGEAAVPVDAAYYLDASRQLPESLTPRDRRDVEAVRKNLVGSELNDRERRAIIEFDEMRSRHERIQGQTSDDLRLASLKIVRRGLEAVLQGAQGAVRWSELRTLANEPRHLVRAIAPSTSDIIMGQRLGTLAVDNAMAGYTDFMISQWLTEYVLVPLDLVVLGRKRIPEPGIFWKSVLAKTDQPADLVSPWPARAREIVAAPPAVV
jgi:6-phosphofructokinase 1